MRFLTNQKVKKRPLSSMSPLIIYDENNDFYLTIGSPGGKAIISYILRVLIDVLYLEKNIYQSIKSPNYIAVNGKIFKNEKLNLKLKKKGIVRKLTSGLAIIQKKNDYYIGFAIIEEMEGGVIKFCFTISCLYKTLIRH